MYFVSISRLRKINKISQDREGLLFFQIQEGKKAGAPEVFFFQFEQTLFSYQVGDFHNSEL